MELVKRKKLPLTFELKFDYKGIHLTARVTQWLSPKTDIGHYSLIIEDDDRNILYAQNSVGGAPDKRDIKWLNDTIQEICKYGIDNIDGSMEIS